MKQPFIKFLKVIGTWRDVADAARTTIRKDSGTGEPSKKWKKTILLCQHSPIRKISVNWKWSDLPSWVSVHFVRHKFGIDHFVSTQRSDRTGVDRNSARQDAPVEHECIANVEEILFISRRRLCNQASPETRNAWKLVLEKLKEKEPEIVECCVPECVYRGFCPEFKCCGFVNTDAYKEMLTKYRTI